MTPKREKDFFLNKLAYPTSVAISVHHDEVNKMLSYRRETALKDAL